MSLLQRVAHAGSLAVLVVFVGCSAPRSEPVYGEVPGITAPVAGLGFAEGRLMTEVQPAAGSVQPAPRLEKPELIVTPDQSIAGTVVSVNDVGRFVVLKFPLGRMPTVNSLLFVYRQGLKVAELTVTGPQQDDHTVADIRTGSCRVNDEVRDQ